MISTKLLLRADKLTSGGEAPIYLRITKNRKHAYLFTGFKVMESYWDSSRSKLKPGYPNSTSGNALLRRLVYSAESEALQLEQKGRPYSAKTIKEAVLDQNSDNLISYAHSWIEARKNLGRIGYGTYTRYKSVLAKLEAYCKGYLRIDEFTSEFIKVYELHLKMKQNNSTNTVTSNLSMLRALARDMIREGIIKVDDNPFLVYRFRFEESKRSFLTKEEIAAFASVKLPAGSKQQLTQFVFLFCCETGLRIGDALRLKKENYNGTHIVYFCQKTRNHDTLKLTRRASQIIYPLISDARLPGAYIFNFLNPRLQADESTALRDQKSATALINKNLNIIAQRAKLNRQLSSHVARHSLSINALLKGLSLEEIKAILNHKDVKTTQIYARVVSSMKDAAVDKLDMN